MTQENDAMQLVKLPKLDTAEAILDWVDEAGSHPNIYGRKPSDRDIATHLAECVRLRQAWKPCKHSPPHTPVCARCNEEAAMKNRSG